MTEKIKQKKINYFLSFLKESFYTNVNQLKTEKMKNTKTINGAELLTILSKNKGVTFAHVVAFTDEHGSRTAGGRKVLQKLTFRNITIGSSYESRVERRIEGEFESQEMTGKAFVEGTNCVAYATKNESKKYLVCDQELKAKVHTQFFHNGQPIKKADAIAQDLFAPSYFAPKQTAGRGQVSEDKNFFRLTIGLDNIIAITLRGQKFRIAD